MVSKLEKYSQLYSHLQILFVLFLIAGPEVVDGDEEGQESHDHGQLHEGGNHSADHSGADGKISHH